MGHRFVTVLDANKQFIEYVHPALARKLIKDNYAKVFSTDPFTVQLLLEVSIKLRAGKLSLRDLV